MLTGRSTAEFPALECNGRRLLGGSYTGFTQLKDIRFPVEFASLIAVNLLLQQLVTLFHGAWTINKQKLQQLVTVTR